MTSLGLDLLSTLSGDLVWIPDRREHGTLGDEIASQSYEVETTIGTVEEGYNFFPAEDILTGRPESHDTDLDEMTFGDRSR